MGTEDHILVTGKIKSQNQLKDGYIIADKDTGLIQSIVLDKVFEGEFTGERFDYSDEYIIMPGDFNAHSHPEQSLYTDIVDRNWDLSTWCRNTIYKYTPLLGKEHIYFGCLRAFSRMLKLGVTSVMVSFYCHNKTGNAFDMEVLRAAEDVGIRLYFGRMNYDIVNNDAYEAKVNSQTCYYEAPCEAERYFIELMGSESERITVSPSIHSIHASTREAIINAIRLGNKYDRYIQFHLSEDPGDVELSLKLYGLRPIEFLEDLYLKGEVDGLQNVILSDCVWIDDYERELIKKYDMKVVLNPRMNARIKTGEARLDKLIETGVFPFLGTDGEASNDDLSVTGEKEFLKKRFSSISPLILDNLGGQGIKLKNGFVGKLGENSYCDLKVLKDNDISEVIVGGKRVVECGKLITMDVDKDIEKGLKNSVSDLFC